MMIRFRDSQRDDGDFLKSIGIEATTNIDLQGLNERVARRSAVIARLATEQHDIEHEARYLNELAARRFNLGDRVVVTCGTYDYHGTIVRRTRQGYHVALDRVSGGDHYGDAIDHVRRGRMNWTFREIVDGKVKIHGPKK